jgi:hypothetical protein
MRHHDQQTGMSALRAEKFDTEISFIFAVAHNCQSTHPGPYYGIIIIIIIMGVNK